MAFHFLLFPDSGRNVLEDFIALPSPSAVVGRSWLMRVDILAMTKDADARRAQAWPARPFPDGVSQSLCAKVIISFEPTMRLQLWVPAKFVEMDDWRVEIKEAGGWNCPLAVPVLKPTARCPIRSEQHLLTTRELRTRPLLKYLECKWSGCNSATPLHLPRFEVSAVVVAPTHDFPDTWMLLPRFCMQIINLSSPRHCLNLGDFNWFYVIYWACT